MWRVGLQMDTGRYGMCSVERKGRVADVGIDVGKHEDNAQGKDKGYRQSRKKMGDRGSGLRDGEWGEEGFGTD